MRDRMKLSADDGEKVTATAARQLILVGGILAIALSPTLLVIQTPLDQIQLRSLSAVVVDIVLGAILLLAVGKFRESQVTGILLALVSSIGLLALGGTAGRIGGLFGIVGALVGSVAIVEDVVGVLQGIIEDARSLLTAGKEAAKPPKAPPKRKKGSAAKKSTEEVEESTVEGGGKGQGGRS